MDVVTDSSVKVSTRYMVSFKRQQSEQVCAGAEKLDLVFRWISLHMVTNFRICSQQNAFDRP